MAHLPILVVDALNLPQVWKMTTRSKVILSVVGPFSRLGNNLVFSCARNGTDYCDYSSESKWMQYNVHQYHRLARDSGARMVCGAGPSPLFWDMATFAVHRRVKREDARDELVRVEHANDLKFNISGGGLRSMINVIDGGADFFSSKRFESDPFIEASPTSDGTGAKHAKPLAVQKRYLGGGVGINSRWKYLSLLADCNGNTLNLSRIQVPYPSLQTSTEFCENKSIVNVLVFYFLRVLLTTVLLFKPLRNLMLRNSLLPNPGQGPSPKQMGQNYLILDSKGFTRSGKVRRVRLQINGDFKFQAGAVGLAEAGLCFVFGDELIRQAGGFYSPSSCFGVQLKTRLERVGVQFLDL